MLKRTFSYGGWACGVSEHSGGERVSGCCYYVLILPYGSRTIIRAWSDRETRTFDSTSAFRPRFHTTHRNRTHMETVDAICRQSIGAGRQREDVTDRNASDRSKVECVRWSPNGLCQRQVKEKYPAHVMMLGSPYPVRPTRKSEISFIYEAT